MRSPQSKMIIRYGIAESPPPGYKPEQFRLCLGHHGANGYGMYIKEAEPVGSERQEDTAEDSAA